MMQMVMVTIGITLTVIVIIAIFSVFPSLVAGFACPNPTTLIPNSISRNSIFSQPVASNAIFGSDGGFVYTFNSNNGNLDKLDSTNTVVISKPMDNGQFVTAQNNFVYVPNANNTISVFNSSLIKVTSINKSPGATGFIGSGGGFVYTYDQNTGNIIKIDSSNNVILDIPIDNNGKLTAQNGYVYENNGNNTISVFNTSLVKVSSINLSTTPSNPISSGGGFVYTYDQNTGNLIQFGPKNTITQNIPIDSTGELTAQNGFLYEANSNNTISVFNAGTSQTNSASSITQAWINGCNTIQTQTVIVPILLSLAIIIAVLVVLAKIMV